LPTPKLNKAACLLLLALVVIAACGHSSTKASKPKPSPSPSASPSPSPPPTAPSPLDSPLPGEIAGDLPGSNLPVSGPLAYPLLIQIENTAPSRPQAGIDAGSMLFEYVTEAGITRFSVLFHRVPGVVGPVRSARFVSVYLYHRFGALLMASGGSGATYGKIFADPGLPALINDFDHGVHFFRWGGRPAPHNVYTTQPMMLAAAGAGARPEKHDDILRSVSWAGTEPAPAFTAGLVRTTFNFNGSTYDVVSDGQAQTDVLFGAVRPKSVIIMHVNQWTNGMPLDVNGQPTRDFDLNSGGAAEMYANGTVIRGRWVSPGDHAVLQYVNAAGQPVGMPPGLVWVALEQ
jgi:Protein of unknown function (DUF3048) N-terminal domain/Protein of unknown function (DUF3048) C-terminal domain